MLKGVLSWGDILLLSPSENSENFTPSQLGIDGFQDMFTIDLKEATKAIKLLNTLLFIFMRQKSRFIILSGANSPTLPY